MNNVIVIIYPYKNFNIMTDMIIDDDDICETDDIIVDYIKKITLTKFSKCNHEEDCECTKVFNIKDEDSFNDIMKSYLKISSVLLLISWDKKIKSKVIELIQQHNPTITHIMLSEQCYAYPALKEICESNSIKLNTSLKEIIASSQSKN
jgi:hypothetical protein